MNKIIFVAVVVLWGTGCCAAQLDAIKTELEKTTNIILARLEDDGYKITNNDLHQNLEIREYIKQAQILLQQEREQALKSREVAHIKLDKVHKISELADKGELLRSLTFGVVAKFEQQQMYEHRMHIEQEGGSRSGTCSHEHSDAE